MKTPMWGAALGRARLTRPFAQRIGNHRRQDFFSKGADGVDFGV